MNIMSYILFAVALIELVFIIILLIKKEKRLNKTIDDYVIKILANEKIDPNDVDKKITGDGDNTFIYIVKSFAFHNQGEYQKCINLLLTLLAKKNMKRSYINTVHFLTALCYQKMKKYSDAKKHISSVKMNYFSGEPVHIRILKSEIEVYAGNVNAVKDIIDNRPPLCAVEIMKRAYKESDNEDIIIAALGKDLDDEKLLTVLLKKCLEYKQKRVEEIIFKKVKNPNFNEKHIKMIIKWIKQCEEPEKILTMIDKSNLNNYIKKALKIFTINISGEDEINIKVLIEDIRKNDYEFVKENPQIIIQVLLETGYYKYAQLFIK